MTNRWMTAAILVALLAGAAACAPSTRRSGPEPVAIPPLRVGLAPDSPPIAFKQGGQLAGIEVDLAVQLASDLRRPLRIAELRWDDLIPALLGGQIDVIMSGMTTTRAREFRVAFAEPYLKTGITALMRLYEAPSYDTPAKIMGSTARIGVVKGTTAEKFVRERCPGASRLPYPSPQDAVTELRNRRIDLFVGDAQLVAWFLSANESELAGMFTPMTDDALAWGFRPGDDGLRTAANAALARWKEDGTLKQILRRWLRLWPGLD